MKQFALAINYALGKQGWRIQLDTSVYTPYRVFRMLGNTKKGQCRPLKIAAYNRCGSGFSKDLEKQFMRSLVQQQQLKVTAKSTSAMPPPPPRAAYSTQRQQSRTTKSKSTGCRITPELRQYLLKRLRQWGNACPVIADVQPARQSSKTARFQCSESAVYVSFSNTKHCQGGKVHRGNNIFCIIDPDMFSVQWVCHGSPCSFFQDNLPFHAAQSML